MFIGVDFDGTCVEHEYPRLGADVPGAVETLRDLSENHALILYTMRSGEELLQAQRWFEDRGIRLYAVNDNPSQEGWTQSRKVYCHVYIDDAALGCPLVKTRFRPYVDWTKVRELLLDKGVLP